VATAQSKAEEAVAEVDAALAEIRPRLEGFYDYRRLDLAAPAAAAIGQVIAFYEQRHDLLTKARIHLLALVGDGHPALDVQEVDPAVYADLKANAASIELALSRFAEGTAAGMALTADAPQPK
jgi:hypothetical protein